MDPVDPLDPLMNSKNAVFIVKVVSLGQHGALALCFFDFSKDVLHETPTCGPKSEHIHEQGLENSPDFAPATVQLRISLRTSWD